MIYSWTILLFFHKLPNWLYFLTPGEIGISLAYALATNLLESLAALCVPLVISLALPPKWFREAFVARGAALGLSGLGFMMDLAYHFRLSEDYPKLLPTTWALEVILVLIVLFVFAAGRVAILRRMLEALADRATVFLYFSIPVSLLAFVTVIVRWIAQAIG
jgi:cytochrome bd-type quinol oxidase subunit 1